MQYSAKAAAGTETELQRLGQAAERRSSQVAALGMNCDMNVSGGLHYGGNFNNNVGEAALRGVLNFVLERTHEKQAVPCAVCKARHNL